MNIRFIALCLSLLLLSLLGCEKKAEAPASDAGTQTAATPVRADESQKADPCSLLEPKEVEAVMGTLAGPPYLTREASDDNKPTDNGDACVYETTDFRTIRLSVTWEDGATALKAITLPMRMLSGGAAPSGDEETNTELKAAKTLLPGGVQIAGEWDEADSLGCCQIFALRGDRMITFDYRGWRADTNAAAGLLNQALLRLDHPLAINGSTGNAAALKYDEQRPAKKAACELLSRAEAEAIVGPLLEEPKPNADGTGCVYRYTQAESKESPWKDAPDQFKSLAGGLLGGRAGFVAGPVDAVLTVYWRGGFRQLNDSALVAGAVSGSYAGTPGMPKRTEGPVTGGPWAEAGQNALNFTAVKNDVAVMIDTEPMLSEEQVELRRRLVAKAIEKI
jgi:hypothetical protein